VTDEQTVESSAGGGGLDGRVGQRAPRLTGLLALAAYGLLPVAGIFGWSFAVFGAVVVSQCMDLVIVNNEDVRVALARGQFGIATRTLVREAGVLALIFSASWTTRGHVRASAFVLLAMAGLRITYNLLMVLIRRRAVLPVETVNIDIAGIRPPPPLPEIMRKRLSERFHGLSAIGLTGAAFGVVADHALVLYIVTGLVDLVELAAVAAAVLWLLRSRGSAIQNRYLDQVHRRVVALAPEVMLYHTGTIDSAHQVNMWLSAMERLGRPTVIALRERFYLEEIATTTLPIICIPDSVDFMTFTLPSVRVAMYTANVGKVIHMLREPGVRHIFVGHGDSDKTASFNPFSKVYSEVWVAGEAGRDRYRKAAVGIRDEDIVEVGRPQLDGIRVVRELIGDRDITVLYAPTWEGWTNDPTHTSLLRTGPALVERLVALAGVRVIYKPHPFTGTVSRAAVSADAKIRATLARAGNGNRTVAGASPTLYECFNDADLMVADISSVLSDFIFSEKPYIVPNLTALNEAAFCEKFPSAGQAYLLDPAADRIGAILDLIRRSDPLAADRRVLKHYLLGPDEPDAMTRFAAATDASYNLAVSLSPTRVAAGREQ
jgi:CDP-Glycerol:Poly(glycerophosphate) glycerophosphotransferase